MMSKYANTMILSKPMKKNETTGQQQMKELSANEKEELQKK